MIRIVFADDHAILCEGLSLTLGQQDDPNVVGVAKNGIEAQKLVPEMSPDVVLMDVRMPGCDGIEATAAIKRAPGAEGSGVVDLRGTRMSAWCPCGRQRRLPAQGAW
jgi:DNA-binding NarL/FixJ family response regulator